MKVAVYTIALNEAAHAERWAMSAVEADYRIVGDTGSTDGTVDRLEALGVTVHQIAVLPWRFDLARNAVMSLIPTDADVCCTMDMDRYLEPGWRPALEKAWAANTTALFNRVEYKASVQESNVLRGWPAKNFHHRAGYRFHRPVHEALVYTGDEITADCPEIVMTEVQDLSKNTRSQYLPLMELAHLEGPDDAQICFWLARDLMWAERGSDAAAMFKRYLDLPSSTWSDERSEAMRFIARVEPEQKMYWLDRARLEAPHRREVWLDLAEHFHSVSDWPNLFWACTNGIRTTRMTNSYLDESNAWSFRLNDLGAIAAWHLNVMDLAVEWGTAALTLGPDNQRLKTNLDFFQRLREERRAAQ